jgi:antitoxin ParD1/3/4|uniref:Antitoxin ParD n=14 Tax=Enterobacterales TaxID=91347 RepID=A0A7G9A9Q9_ECOLX|nr:type II toxin-antitoxin system ParD family antitoxin [Escherichia coli]
MAAPVRHGRYAPQKTLSSTSGLSRRHGVNETQCSEKALFALTYFIAKSKLKNQSGRKGAKSVWVYSLTPGASIPIIVLIVNTGGVMARTTSVTIGEQLDSFISRLIDSGRYGSASEVMRSALRLLEQQETNDEVIRQAVIAGLESGESSLSLRDIAAQRKLRHRV